MHFGNFPMSAWEEMHALLLLSCYYQFLYMSIRSCWLCGSDLLYPNQFSVSLNSLMTCLYEGVEVSISNCEFVYFFSQFCRFLFCVFEALWFWLVYILRATVSWGMPGKRWLFFHYAMCLFSPLSCLCIFCEVYLPGTVLP